MTDRLRPALAALLTGGLLVLSACGASGDDPAADRTATQPADAGASTSPTAEDADDADDHGGHDAEPARSKPLREGETRTTIAMPGSYTPSAPYGTGTDDYRRSSSTPSSSATAGSPARRSCRATPTSSTTSSCSRCTPSQVAAAEAKDAAEEDEGLDLLSSTGLDRVQDVNRSSWIGAWRRVARRR